MKSETDLKAELRRIRERARELSGFWISELAAAAYAIEWILGKRTAPPSAEIGGPSGTHGKLAESLAKAAAESASGKTRKPAPTPSKKAAPKSKLRRVK